MVKLRDAVNEMRSGDTPRHTALPAAAFDQIFGEHRDQLVGINEVAAFVENAESIGIAVSSEAQLQPVLLHDDLQLAKLLVCRLGMMAAKVHVALRVENHGRDVLLPEKAVEIAGARSVQRVISEADIGIADLRDSNFCD